MKSFLELMGEHTGRLVHKYDRYADIYDKHFSRFRNKPIKLLEIGVSHGGSLQLWKNYFHKESIIIGLDIDPNSKSTFPDTERIVIRIGDQGNQEWLQNILDEYGPFDIVIDDGSHISDHQKISLETTWNALKPGGVYLCEDTETSVRRDAPFLGGFRKEDTFLEHCKSRIDDLYSNPACDPAGQFLSKFTRECIGIYFHTWIIVFEKSSQPFGKPLELFNGSPAWPAHPETLQRIQTGRETLFAILAHRIMTQIENPHS